MPTTEVVNGQPLRTADSFRAYASPADSVAGYSDLMMGNRYAPVRTAQGLDAQAAALGQSGYATDPAYGQKILQIARSLPAPAAAAPPAPVRVAQAGDPSAIPVNAQPTQGYAVPGQPAAQPQLSTRALIAAASNPWLSKGQQTVVNTLLERQLNQDKVSTIDLGNSVGVMDARGNIVRSIPKGEPNKGPEYGVIGKDEFGKEQYGWRDPRTQTVTPFKAPGLTDSQPSAIPAAPKGIDPKLWREEQSKRAVSEALPADTKVTSQLRQEIQALPSYKNIAQAAPVYKSMIEAAGRDNRAADVNLIYGMAKIMDPGSVVREGEMSIASAIATLPQRLQATVQSQLTGDGRLSPEVRTAIIQEARGRVGAYQSMFDQDMGMYRGIAQRGRMDERDVIPTFGPFETYKPSTPAAPAATAPSVAPQQPAPAIDPAALAEARRRGLIR